MNQLPIPWHVAATELHGNNVVIPDGIQLAACFPFGDTSYQLPKLTGYMSGRILMLRTYTSFTITLNAAAGDTIMESPSIDLAGGNFMMLTYISGSDWQIMLNLNGGPIDTLKFEKYVAKKQVKTEPSSVELGSTHIPMAFSKPMTPVRTLPKKG